MASKGKGVCKAVVLTLPEITITEDFLPLELSGVQEILGMQWLRTMGTMEVDWSTLTMKFEAEN